MPCSQVTAEVPAPREAHKRDAAKVKRIEQGRDQVDQRVRRVSRRLERRRLAKARRIEREHAQPVTIREQGPRLVKIQAGARGQADAVPAEERPAARAAPAADVHACRGYLNPAPVALASRSKRSISLLRRARRRWSRGGHHVNHGRNADAGLGERPLIRGTPTINSGGTRPGRALLSTVRWARPSDDPSAMRQVVMGSSPPSLGHPGSRSSTARRCR